MRQTVTAITGVRGVGTGVQADLTFGLVGCGRIGKRHAELLSSGAIVGARLVAVCDTDPERAEDFATAYGVPGFHSVGEMAAAEPDIAVVCTPSGDHAESTVQLAQSGIHVVVEKPMALTLDDADRMILACSENRVKLFVVKQNRFNLPIQKTREAVESGRLGQMVMGTVRVRWCRDDSYYQQDAWRGTWAQDGGVLANQASHHVDMLEWMMGDVESVFAMSRTALADIEVEDTAVALLKFRSGALGVVEATTATRPKDLEGSLSLLGEFGSIEVGGFALNQLKTWNFVEMDADDATVLEDYSVNPPDVYGFGHKMYLQHVVDCIRGDTQQLVDGFEGRRSLELILAIYESIETGREIPMSFRPKHARLGRVT